LTVEGGKWTTSRRLAEKAVDRLREKGGFSVAPSLSGRRYLKNCEIKDLNSFLNRMREENPDFNENTVDCLTRLYGTECEKVLALAREENELAQPLNSDGELPAQVVYGVRQEMARTLKDTVLRRTGIATLGNPGKEILTRVARIMARELKWNEAKVSEEIENTIYFLKIPSK
jgi:glycerol-3-phosphate dehydrogenase